MDVELFIDFIIDLFEEGQKLEWITIITMQEKWGGCTFGILETIVWTITKLQFQHWTITKLQFSARTKHSAG